MEYNFDKIYNLLKTHLVLNDDDFLCSDSLGLTQDQFINLFMSIKEKAKNSIEYPDQNFFVSQFVFQYKDEIIIGRELWGQGWGCQFLLARSFPEIQYDKSKVFRL